MRSVACLLLAGLLAAPAAAAPPVLRGTGAKGATPGAPTAAEINALQTEAARGGWGPVARRLHAAAIGRYARAPGSAQAWYYLFRWADLFATTEAQATANWKAEVERVKVGYPPFQAEVGERPLAGLWPDDLRAFALSTPGFSVEFFTLWQPLDQPVVVMTILAQLWRQDPAVFREYASLALAIAVVYDVPPPPDWPHGQVGPEALSRRLPAPADAFAFFVKADRAGATLQRLSRLPAAELKFVVDTSTPLPELAWAQASVRVPLAGLERLYAGVRYRRDRLEQGTLMWPDPTYRLPDLLERGGICIDQAYLAATVGKAKGVPTLIFRGAGMDGRHAWFGYLDGNGRWQLDGGRGNEQKLVTGVAFDPQTWGNISDHELAFLAEGFRRLPLYNTSRMHEQFAELYYSSGDFPAAAKAARLAVNCEPRNLDAWNTLLVAQQRLGGDPRQFETLLREGARTFQRYPDIESVFETMISRSLRARGQTSEADFVQRSTGQKYAAERGDLSARQAEEIIQQSIAGGDAGRSIVTYYRVLDTYGRGAGMEFFDGVVRPFADHLLETDRPREALQAVEHARRTLRVEPNTQLELSLNELAERARRAMR